MSTVKALFIKRVSEDAIIPTKGSKYSAGFDLYSPIDTVVKANDRLLIDTKIQINFPYGCYGRIAPRSGLALKYGIDVLAGVIDFDFLGNIGVILHNTSTSDYNVKKGDRIAQLIIEKIETDIEVKEVDKLGESDRGAGGFGSTGK